MQPSNYTKGFLSMMGSGLCISLLATLGVLIFKTGANPLTLLTGRFLIASFLFLATILIWNRKLFIIKLADAGWFLGLIISSLVSLLTYFYGLRIIKIVAIQTGIYYTYPIWIAVAAALYTRKLNKRIFISLPIAFIGLLLLLKIIPNFTAIVDPRGIALVLVGAIFWAAYYLFIQKLTKKYHPFTIMFYNAISLAVLFSVIQSPLVSLQQVTTTAAWYILALGFFTTYLSYLFLNYAIKFNNATLAGIHNMFSPAFTVLMAFGVLGQGITFLQGLGMALIMFNIWFLKR